MRIKHSQKGFTLLEVIMAALIVGILAMAALPNVLGSDKEARISRVQADMKNIATAQELFRMSGGTGTYTTTLSELTETGHGNYTPFLTEVPKDPWGNDYTVTSTGTSPNRVWTITSGGPDGSTTQTDDINRKLGTD